MEIIQRGRVHDSLTYDVYHKGAGIRVAVGIGEGVDDGMWSQVEEVSTVVGGCHVDRAKCVHGCRRRPCHHGSIIT